MSGWLWMAVVLSGGSDPADVHVPCARIEQHPTPWALKVTQPGGETVWVIERGAHVRIQAGGLPLEVASGPSRFSGLPLHLPDGASMRIEAVAATPALVEVGRACVVDPQALSWWSGLNRLAAARTGLADVLAALDPQMHHAPSGLARAAARHVKAYQLAAAGLADLAHADYVAVVDEWQALADPTRAGAAALGAAQTANAAGRSADALRWARQAQQLLTAPPAEAFRDMAVHSECVALQSLGELATAVECLIRVDQLQAQAGDANGRANTLVTLAQVQYTLGRYADARDSERLALAIPPKSLLPLVRGRVLLHAARRLGDEGEITPAIDAYAEALQCFADAGDAGRTWEAEALSKLVRLYAKLGMAEMAYRTATRLLTAVPAEQDPVQVAILLNTLSHVEEAGQRPEAAVRWVQLAEDIYRALGQAAGIFESQLRQQEIRSLHGLDGTASTDLQTLRQLPHSVVDDHRLRLLAAVEAERAGRLGEADATLAEVLAVPQDVGQRLQSLMVLARIWQARGRVAEAYAQVAQGILDSAARARGAAHVGQGWLAMRATAALRPLLVDLWARLPAAQRMPEQLWSDWAAGLSAHAVQPARAARDVVPDYAVSQVVEEAWRTRMPVDARVDGALARTLLGGGGAPSAPAWPTPSLRALQAQLRPGDLLLMLATGQDHSVRLALSPAQIQIDLLPGLAPLSVSVNELAARVQDPATPLPGIAQARGPVEQWLLADLGSTPPRRLLLLADDLLMRIPVPVLHWPGTSVPLTAHTGIGWISDVRVGQRAAMPPHRPDRQMRIVVAGRPEASGHRLRPLEAPEQEVQSIRARVERLPVSTYLDRAAHRDALLQALRSEGDWLHLASHGWSQPGLLGQAGVWLSAPEATGQPQFLSWLDVAGERLGADLAVLNACQTAAVDPQAVREGSMSFAVSISAAGVRNTVASFWPISDPAMAIWVPAFYDGMQGRDADASFEALRLAQEALRQSRLYAHPYYWASLGHFQRLDVPSAP